MFSHADPGDRSALLTAHRHLRVLAMLILTALMISLVFFGSTQSRNAKAALPATPAGWSLQWSDDFTGAAGTGANTGNWLYDLGHCYNDPNCPTAASNWGTGEIENNTTSTANVYHDGAGNLVIKAIRDGSGNWTSGRIETQRTNFQPPAGGVMRIEGRLKLPNVSGAGAQGYWPAFWTLGAAFRGVYTNWPGVGEMDIMENVNGVNTAYGTLHCGTNPGGYCNEKTGLGNTRSGFSPTLQADYHTYAVELDYSTNPQQMRWYVDGIQYHTVTAGQMDAATWSNTANHGFFIILNVAIGGDWPGAPTASTTSGGAMVVDYVAVYYKGGTAPTATRTRTATSGGTAPTATRTRTPTTGTGATCSAADFTCGVINTNSTQSLVWFKPTGYTAGYVILHGNLPGNVNMTYNSGTARWEYTINQSAGQNLTYSFTYAKNGLQYDSANFSYTK